MFQAISLLMESGALLFVVIVIHLLFGCVRLQILNSKGKVQLQVNLRLAKHLSR